MAEQEMFSSVASKFMALYKERVVKKFREASDTRQLDALLQNNEFARTLFGLSQTLCTRYDSDVWQAKVLDTIDLESIYANVDSMEGSEDDYVDRLVKELLRYFKNDFFKWCNKPDCVHCGNSGEEMMGAGHEGPNSVERQFDCGIVEVYKCPKCQKMTRFPRYNDPLKLLDTRQGRCGEWCNLFMLFLKSFGIESRYIWNREDHVWCEFYSTNLNRWVHLDSCEQSFDEPHIYSVNWNKQMSYTIAFSNNGTNDVSNRYIVKNQLPRDQISEGDLRYLLKTITKRLRSTLNDNEICKLAFRDERELLEWVGGNTLMATKTRSAFMGRVSGAASWKKQRGEDGKS
ncbi:LANO_0E08086g1_1 [Lachancea nothofagi CBS 11611]|uniref:Peptide-N(4)-(N-acetyl-beta-glucosaminyl)asparagine amidase n=1 Tax=Lachancea nothofagi CBS 11611 TaxID=1266666 RepID=A0A1G4JUV4_9SACH|nr:LANO_0E08086g1_1 [Lachancea nothofagi CBS 11611]